MKNNYEEMIYKGISFVLGLLLLIYQYLQAENSAWQSKFQLIYGVLLLMAIIIMAEIDLKTMEIPNKVLAMFLILGEIQILWHWSQWLDYLLAFMIMGVLLFLLSMAFGGKLGGGDIKLMALAGLCLGAVHVFIALTIGASIAVIIGLLLIITGKIKRDTPIAFGPFLGAGIFLSYVFGDWIWQWIISISI